ncbi:tyrosine-type recombinase/integrase [Arthrobacter zhaoxinii]|uniref:tyrosine-type recombinase/integrase n=1 Tax=Arthrobacter zhaoxinii TaxID=2964616 RepID=UPI0021020992|nr:site-specific integrase [Arthrobacter zhaoxinii]MCQ1999532.1 site-specific integrase [Arthrobacter zhaoxinii]
MASIKKRPDGHWRARYRDEAGKEHAKHFPRKIDAQRWLDEVTASVVTGTYVDPKAGTITFAQWFTQWEERQIWSRGTKLSAAQALQSTTFADVQMKKIMPSHVQAWVKSMTLPAETRKSGLSPATVKVRYNLVRSAFKGAVADRVIVLDPSDNIKLPRERRPEVAMTIPTTAQVAAALDAAPEWFRAYIGVCAFAGLRLGEASGLQVGDIDFLRRTLKVSRQVQGENRKKAEVVAPKHGSERVVYIPARLTEMIAQHVEQVGVHGDEGWLFSTGGHLWNRGMAGYYWREVREACGMGEFTLHDLRHFFASALIASSCDVATVQRTLGHSQPSITLDIYTHLWPTAEDKTRTAADSLMAAVLDGPADSVRTEAQ